MDFYTGVGSRETPFHILDLMRLLAVKFAHKGYMLRSGGAQGADQAFEAGCREANGLCKIYRPHHATPAAMELAAKYHGAWHLCGEWARKLHARNAFQVLGDDLKTPSSMLICWTRDGANTHQQRSIATGGTGTAISIASEAGIRVANLARQYDLDCALNWLKS